MELFWDSDGDFRNWHSVGEIPEESPGWIWLVDHRVGRLELPYQVSPDELRTAAAEANGLDWSSVIPDYRTGQRELCQACIWTRKPRPRRKAVTRLSGWRAVDLCEACAAIHEEVATETLR